MDLRLEQIKETKQPQPKASMDLGTEAEKTDLETGQIKETKQQKIQTKIEEET